MTEPASEAPAATPQRRPGRSRIHPTGLVVGVVGLLFTFVASALTYAETRNREDEALESVADTLAEDVDALVTPIDVLVSGVRGGVIATGEANQRDMERVMGTRVEDSPILDAAIVLAVERRQGFQNFAQTGESSFVNLDLEEQAPDVVASRIEALENAPEDLLTIIASERVDEELRVGLATKVRTDPEAAAGAQTDLNDWVVYVEASSTPELLRDLMTSIGENVDFAVFLDTEPRDDALILSTTQETPLDSAAATRPITIGEQPGLLVVEASGSLLSASERFSPYMVLAAGLVLTLVITPLVNRLASRREEVGILSAQRDELDRALAISRKIEQELRASEQRFRSVLHSSPDIVLWLDPDDSSLQVLNRDELLGHPAGQISSIDALVELVHEADRETAGEGFRRLSVADPGVITEFEGRFRRPDGEWEWLRIRGARVERAGTDTAYILAVLTNVTEHKREEARRAQLEQQLVQSQRLEAVGQLAGGVAHDFNNILAAILSGAELVLDEVEGQARDDVEEIRRTARRGSDLARQLLLFSRRDRGSSPEVVDLNEVVRDIETMLGRTLDDSIELRTDLGDDLYKIHIDPSQIERVLMNLTINARDAMPEGGVITISTRNRETDDDLLATRPDLSAGSYVELRVSDTGTGMPEDVRQRAFEPFFSTKEKGKGTGLGLATVYGVVQGAQGHVEIESELGAGTTFVMLFPRTRIDERAPSGTTTEQALEGGTERILVVEDEDAVREATRRLLSKRGYQVTVAADGEEATRLARQEEFDLLLTDILMPGGMNGREVAQAVRGLQPRIGLLYMTGYGDDVLESVGIDDDEEEALIVRKPFTEEQLLRAVRLALARVMEPAP